MYFPNHAANAANTHAGRRMVQDEQRARKAASMMEKPCELILVRHGETAWNKEGRLQGQQEPGPPLDELGLQQAAVAADTLRQRYPHVEAVFSSDLLRAVQTAEVVAAAYSLQQVQQHKGLRERNMGVLQGLTYTEAPHVQPEAWAALQSDNTSTSVPGGESLDEVRERLTAAVLDIAAAHPGGRVVLISHGGALHALHRAARGYQAKGKVFNCSVSVMLAEADAVGSRQQQQQQQQQDPNHHHQHHPHESHADQAQRAHAHATASSSQHPHLNPTDAASLRLQVVAADEEQVAVVWCDSTDMCDHCNDSSSSDGASGTSRPAGYAHAAPSPPGSSTAGGAADGSTNAPPAAAATGAPCLQEGSQGSGKGRMKCCGGGRVQGGRLALLSWNDSYALQAAHLQSDKAFGGSSRAG